jgi:hypothetical protein
LAAGLGSTILTRRWASEDRRAAWQREDRLRWQADRMQIYARLVTALEAWEAEVHRLTDWMKADEQFDAAEWERHNRAVNELTMLVFLTAPQKVSFVARQCLKAFSAARYALSHDRVEWRNDPAILTKTNDASRAINRLMDAMRADLGLGGDERPAGTARYPAG